MAAIYLMCVRVLIWLGPSEDADADAASSEVIRACVSLGSPLRMTSLSLEQSQAFLVDDYLPHDHRPEPGLALKGFAAIAQMCKERQWFQRLWVVQEASIQI